jgi:hypothetical protein
MQGSRAAPGYTPEGMTAGSRITGSQNQDRVFFRSSACRACSGHIAQESKQCRAGVFVHQFRQSPSPVEFDADTRASQPGAHAAREQYREPGSGGKLGPGIVGTQAHPALAPEGEPGGEQEKPAAQDHVHPARAAEHEIDNTDSRPGHGFGLQQSPHAENHNQQKGDDRTTRVLRGLFSVSSCAATATLPQCARWRYSTLPAVVACIPNL